MSLKNEIPEESKMSAEKILLESKIPVESEKLSKSDKSAELERPVGSKKSVESRKAAESKKSYIFVLAGNPNSGKTTLFNELTGSTQYVGNWPGVTVEKKEGRLRKSKENVTVVDLPGIYSLSPYSLEEVIARDYITENKPDVVVNIVDASNIERNLYLTTQLLELGTPVVVAMNMMDVVRNRNDSIDIKKMEKLLGVPVAPVSAIRGEGVDEVISKALSAVISGSMKTTEGTTAESTVDTTAGATMSTTAELTANTAAGATANTTTGSTASTTAGVIMDTIAELSANTTAGAAGAARGIRFDDRIEKCIDKVIRTLVSLKKEYIYDLRWLAIKLLESDEKIIKRIDLPEQVEKTIGECRAELESTFGDDAESIIADQRYKFIGEIVRQAVRKSGSEKLSLSDKIDKVVTNRILAIPIFFLIMWFVYWVSISTLGDYTIGWVETLVVERLGGAVRGLLETANASDWITGFVVDGIIGGVGSVLTFVPQLMILFFFISLLEDCGYMARVAFIMDRIFRKFGLSGKSFIPMLIGTGCSVPAIMSTRTIENDRDRKMTIILTPFIPCGAKLPVFAMFTAAFFTDKAWVAPSMYLVGIAVAILSGILLKNTILKGDTAPFIMELPEYRLPKLKGLLIHMWERGKAFMIKAGTVIFVAAGLIWFAQSFDFSLKMVETDQSILAGIGKKIAPVFAPLGFGDWKPAVATVTGLLAKEVIVSTLGILQGIGEVVEDDPTLLESLRQGFTALSAYSFMIFTLLAAPCVAAISAMKREFNSWKWTFIAAGYQTGVAWVSAMLVYQVGRLLSI